MVFYRIEKGPVTLTIHGRLPRVVKDYRGVMVEGSDRAVFQKRSCI